MRKIPPKLREEMASDPYYKKCARYGSDCSKKITWEHAFIYAGKQVNEKWAIIPLCEYHHLGAGLEKHANELIALRRATEADLLKYPKRDWKQLRSYLEKENEVHPSWRCTVKKER